MTAFRHVFAGCVLLVPLGRAWCADDPAEKFRGGKVQWARLQTDSPYWSRHSERDVHVLNLMRTHSSLNIDDTWYTARADNLEELCTYPFIFAENVSMLSDADANNVAEYLRRGGFLLIDACIHIQINPDAEAFLAAQTKTLLRQFPDLRIVDLEPKHAIFSIYFKLSQFPPQTKSSTNPSWANRSTAPLRGLFLGKRMIGVISLSGFQCGWNGSPRGQTATGAVQMVTNIYVYAMIR
jgi:hypothetical protein